MRVGEGGRDEGLKLKKFPSPNSVVWKTIHLPSCFLSRLLFIPPISPCYEVLSIKNIKGLFQKYCCDCLHMSPLWPLRESAVAFRCLNLICFLSDLIVSVFNFLKSPTSDLKEKEEAFLPTSHLSHTTIFCPPTFSFCVPPL